uniref:Uncharacterized protein LOC104210419 n=1 Tax=Nicotiana sylvestris TaxID=4096 RepID=A0A1U7V796_NICSY|nr:PREDICTED: uncharacterized protein LOC104210419 [Nicotiana sylvestris]
MLQLDGVQLPELKCECLTLKCHITKFNLYGVASLLQASPYVETLNIDTGSYDICIYGRFESSYLCKGDQIDFESCISNVTVPNLKSVKIVYSIRMCCEPSDKLFKLSEFLLKDAMALEKFLLVAKRRMCWICNSKKFVAQYSSRLASNLLACRRPSTNFMMTFH